MNQTKTPEQIALQIYTLFAKLPRRDQERILAELASLNSPEAA
jgi:hypothetical protein